MIILIAIAVILALIGVILCMTWRLTRAREDIYRAEHETSRVRVQHMAARDAAKKGEQRCQELLSQMQAQVANTAQALNIARHIQVIGEELHEFFDLVTQPSLEGSHAKHAITAAPAPVPDEPGDLPGAFQTDGHQTDSYPADGYQTEVYEADGYPAEAYPGLYQQDGYQHNGYHHATGHRCQRSHRTGRTG